MRDVFHALGGWRLAAITTSIALLVATFVGASTEIRRASLHAEVRSLRARLAEKTTQAARRERELARVASAVDRLADRAAALRSRADEVRRLAHMEQSREPAAAGGASLVASSEGRPPASRTAARALERLERLEDETAIVGDSVAVLTALLKEPPVSRGGVPSLWPVHGLVTSSFGVRSSPLGEGREMHPGIDIQARYGTPVEATADGEVTFAGRDPGYGGLVVVSHGVGVDTLYGHLSALYVREGQTVRRGQPIGAVGASGRATGAHLHYEVRLRGEPVDPSRYLASWTPGR
ncbi:MAG TPA: peptidoglycan DD-metalloendopeptidase family protein [Candidatus Binatia bacterium]|nr:peptidoglycan DD-metalloendopeptidase family protein [Candidatus Binatia bacterium]